MTILIAEGMHEKGIELLHGSGIKTVFPQDRFAKSDIEALIVRSVFQVNEEVLKEYPRLKIVAKLGTGLDNVDQERCRAAGVEVINAPAMNSVSTAEFTVMQIIGLYKNAFNIYERVKNRDLRRALYFGNELAEKTAGVIGCGSVGKNIVSRLRAFVRQVNVYDKDAGKGEDDGNVRFVERMDELFPESDILVLSITLKGNEKLVSRGFLAKLKKDAMVVNTARGALIDEPALIEFLTENPQARYYCDVLEDEPNYYKLPEDQDYKNPLLELNNVCFTPHIAGMTAECQAKIAVEVAGRIISCATAAQRG